MADSPLVVVPHLYLDTSILIDVFRNRRTASTRLLEEARQKNWRISTSQFAVMELLDVEQDDRFFLGEAKAYIEACTPEQLHSSLNRLGFNIT